MKSDDLIVALARAAREVGLPPIPRQHENDPACWEKVARRQAVELESRRLVNAELSRERAQADADREAALDLAAQYAERAGVSVERDEILRYVAQYWQSRGQLEKQWHLLEVQRWDTLCLVRDLEKVASGRLRLRGVDSAEGVARVVAGELTKLHSAAGPKRRSTDLFARPDAPGMPDAVAHVEAAQPAASDVGGLEQSGLFDVEAPAAPAGSAEPRVSLRRSNRRELVTVEATGGVL